MKNQEATGSSDEVKQFSVYAAAIMDQSQPDCISTLKVNSKTTLKASLHCWLTLAKKKKRKKKKRRRRGSHLSPIAVIRIIELLFCGSKHEAKQSKKKIIIIVKLSCRVKRASYVYRPIFYFILSIFWTTASLTSKLFRRHTQK